MKMKKIITLFLAISIVLSLFSLGVSAASATFSLSASGSVTVGNQIKVTVELSGSEKIGSWRFSVNYDPAYLEYVSGADSGGGGAVLFSDSSDGVSSISKTVVFRAKKIGSVTVSIAGGAQVVGFDSAANMSVNSPSKKINIVAAPTLSGENTLAALSVSEGELTPAFDAKTTSYAMTVPFEITSFVVSATAKHNAASVSVTPTDALRVGENQIDVVVTAQNGSTKTYTITVTREESELAGVTTELDGKTYQVAYDPATLQIPEGYTPATALLGEKKILVYASPKESIVISFLFTENESGWFVFNEEKQSFTRFLSLSGAANSLVILEPDEDIQVPSGFIPDTITVGEEKVSAYHAENSKEKNIYLVYGMAMDGTVGFFYYDATYGTFTSYFEPAVDAKEQEDAVKEAAALSSLLKDSEKKADQMEIIALAVGIVAALLLIGLVISLATRKKKATPDFSETNVNGEKEENTSPEPTEEETSGEKKPSEEAVPEETERQEASSDETLSALPDQKAGKRRARRTIEEVSFKPRDPGLLMDDTPEILQENFSDELK